MGRTVVPEPEQTDESSTNLLPPTVDAAAAPPEEPVGQQQRCGWRTAAVVASVTFAGCAAALLASRAHQGNSMAAQGGSVALFAFDRAHVVCGGASMCDCSWATGGIQGTCTTRANDQSTCWTCCCQSFFRQDYDRIMSQRGYSGGYGGGNDGGYDRDDDGGNEFEDGYDGGHGYDDRRDDGYDNGYGYDRDRDGVHGHDDVDDRDGYGYDRDRVHDGYDNGYDHDHDGEDHGRDHDSFDNGYGHHHSQDRGDDDRHDGHRVYRHLHHGDMVLVQTPHLAWREATIIRRVGRHHYQVRFDDDEYDTVPLDKVVPLDAMPWYYYLMCGVCVLCLCGLIGGAVAAFMKSRRKVEIY